MNGWLLLIIGLASLAVVLGAVAYCAVKAWRVYRHGTEVYGRLAPFIDQLDGWTVTVEAKAQELTDNSAAIAANLDRLKASLARFQVIAQAFDEGFAPYRRILSYLGR